LTRLVWFIVITLMLGILPGHAQQSSQPLVDASVLKNAIAQAEANTELGEESKTKLLDSYRKSQGFIQSVESFNQQTAAYAAAQKSAAAEAEKIDARLEKDMAAYEGKSPAPPGRLSIEEVEQSIQRDKADLAAQEAKSSDLSSRLEAEGGRPTELRDRLSELKKIQGELAAAAKLPPPEGETELFANARKWLSGAHSAAVRAEISMLEAELASQPMRLALMTAQQDRARFDTLQLRARIKAYDLHAIKLRQGEAEKAQAEAQSAQEEAEGKHPLILQSAQDNTGLSSVIAERTAELESIKSEEAAANEQAQRFEGDLQSVQRKLEVLGMSQALGRVLREQQLRLPTRQLTRSALADRDKLITEASLRQFQYEDERSRLRRINSYLDTLLAGVAEPTATDIRDDLETLARARRELIQQAIDIEATYLQSLGELDFAERRADDAARQYRDFISERLLWIRSSAPLSLDTFKPLPRELVRVLSVPDWWQSLELLAAAVVESPFYIILFLVVAVLLRYRPRILARLRETGDTVGNVDRDQYRTSFEALGLTFLFALLWPLLMFSGGVTLAASAGATDFSNAVAFALTQTSYYFMGIEFLRLLLVKQGLMQRHFRWTVDTAAAVKREITALEIIFIPSVFVAILFESEAQDTVSMFSLIIALLAIARFFARIPNFVQGKLDHFIKLDRTPRRSMLAQSVRYFLITVPCLLVLSILLGYTHTATEFLGLLLYTNALFAGILLIHEFGVRWLRMVRLRMIQAEREAARQAALERAAEPAADEPVVEEEHEPDPEALDDAGRKLLNASLVIIAIFGVWGVWADVLPALGILNSVEMWSTTDLVDGVETKVPVTLADLFVAILIGFAGVVATKRIPALLEIFLRQKVELTSGTVYAGVTLLRYTLVTIFVIVVLSSAGFNWSQIQWAVAALSVGIGFGLQEIVANFISGLILLFEQPIRVGDTVTVGETSGVVTKIRMRATTVRDWDGRELLVPNKEFITGRLLNWSLSDQQSRIVIEIGIAYGSDVPLAMKLALDAAREHPDVLEDPEPFITFDAFGDNSLLLRLRAYLPNVDRRLSISSEIRQVVNDRYNEAGVVIAFPQRDVHLNTLAPLEVTIQESGGGRGLPAE